MVSTPTWFHQWVSWPKIRRGQRKRRGFFEATKYYRVLKGGCSRGGGNWGTLRIPREDWGTLGNIRED